MCHRPSFLARETCDPSNGVCALKHSECGFVDCSELSFNGDRRAPIEDTTSIGHVLVGIFVHHSVHHKSSQALHNAYKSMCYT